VYYNNYGDDRLRRPLSKCIHRPPYSFPRCTLRHHLELIANLNSKRVPIDEQQLVSIQYYSTTLIAQKDPITICPVSDRPDLRARREGGTIKIEEEVRKGKIDNEKIEKYD
jgi:hypothetical protein